MSALTSRQVHLLELADACERDGLGGIYAMSDEQAKNMTVLVARGYMRAVAPTTLMGGKRVAICALADAGRAYLAAFEAAETNERGM